MSASSKVTLTAELKDELSAPLSKVEKQVDQTSKAVEESNKRQATSTQDAAKVIETATARAAGAQEDMEKAISRATGKRNDALHSFEQASKGVTIAEQRLEAARTKAEGGSTAVLTAEKNLEAARYKQEKALHAVATATGNLEEAQAALIAQNDELVNAPEPRVRATRGEAAQSLVPAAAIAGGAMTLGFGKVLNTYADFDKAMSQVKAFTQESDQNMALLRDAAMKYGADTAYSAAEAAGAINELGKAGVSTQDILNGGLGGALTLAAAGELDVTKAAEIASAAMTQFKLSGDQIPHLADLLAAGAGKAMGSVEDMGMALNQAGLVASATGLSVEETTGTLAAFASYGLLGSDAGTSFKTMLQRLQNPSKEAAKEMKALGINMYDANGEFAGMDVLAGQLASSLADKSAAERDAAMATLFGSDAVRAANVLFDQGADGIQKWTEAVDDSGFAARTAGDLQNNLAGDLEKLGGSFDTVFLQSGSGANDVLRLMVQRAEDLVDWIGELPSWLLQANAALILVGGAALLSGAAIPKVMEMRTAIFDLIAPTDALSRRAHAVEKGFLAAGLAVAAITIAKTGIEAINDAVRAGRPDVEAYFNLIKTGGSAAAVDAMKLGESDGWSGSLFPESASKKLKDQLGVVTLEAANAKRAVQALGTMDSLGGLTGWFQKNLSMGDVRKATEDALQLQEAMKGIGKAIDVGESQQGIDALKDMATQLEFNDREVASLINKTPELKSALMGLATAQGLQIDPNDELGLVDLAMGRITLSAPAAGDALDVAAGGAAALGAAAGPSAEELEAMEEELAELGLTLDGVIINMGKFLDLLFATGLATMSYNDAQISYNKTLKSTKKEIEEVIGENGKLGSILDKTGEAFNLNSEAGQKVVGSLQSLVRDGFDQVKAGAATGLGQDELQKKLTGTYNSVLENIKVFEKNDEIAQTLARNLMGIPEGVSVDSWMSETAKTTAEETQRAIHGIDKSVSINVVAKTAGFYSAIGAITGNPLLGSVGVAIQATQNAGGGVYETLPAAAGGAIVPGYAPGVDSEIMRVSPGEALLVPELVQAIGPANIMTLNHLYSNGRPAGGGPARASIGSLLASLGPGAALERAAGGSVVPDTVPSAWVDEFSPSARAPKATPSLAASPTGRGAGSTITLSEGAVQVQVTDSGRAPEELGQIIQEAVTAALEAEREKMEHAY